MLRTTPLFALIPVSLMPVCSAGVLSIQRLDHATEQAFDGYVASYENGPDAGFRNSRAFLMDSQPASKRSAFESGTPVVEVLRGQNVASGHIHHLYGAMRVKGVTAEQVRRTMQQYSKYPEYYKPDVAEARGERAPGGTASDQHFRVEMKLVQSTLWIDVAFDTIYATHYMRLDDHSFETASKSTSIREYKDAHNPSLGTYEPGNDHGFLWRIDTWWHARDRDGGVDLEMTNMTLTRPVPFGVGWWASHKAKSSVENLLLRTRTAVLAANPVPDPPR